MSWQEEFIAALKLNKKHEKTDHDLIDAYTRLADRTAALEAKSNASQAMTVAPSSKLGDPALTFVAGDSLAQLRTDLTEALRSKGQLQARLKLAEDELEKSKSRKKSDTKTIRDLTTERSILSTKVADRDAELKGKAKLLEDMQNEMISLDLQLNMAEQKSKRLQDENKDLIKRWMTRMGQEADAMNNASQFS